MVVILISGNGIGAGKTTLAKKLGDKTLSMAGALRKELKRLYPNVDWYDKSQEYKARKMRIGGKLQIVRDVMVKHGQMRCSNDETYWVRQLTDYLKEMDKLVLGTHRVAIDDIRKVIEVTHVRSLFPVCMHFHVQGPTAIGEPHFENDALEKMADYIIAWGND